MKKSAGRLLATASLAIVLAVPSLVQAVPAVQWLKTFPGMGVSSGYSVRQTADGGFVAAGVMGPDSIWAPGYYYVVRMDADGDTLWTRAVRRESVGYDVAVAYGILQTRDGGFAVFGTDDGNDHSRRPYLVKLSSAGAVQWQSTIYSDTFEHGSSIQQTADAGFALAGPRDRSGVWLRKVDSGGARQWDWTVKEDVRGVWPTFTPVTLAGDGGFVTTGHNDSFGLTLWKVNSAGSTVWRQVYVDEHAYDGLSVVLTADRGFAVVGLAGRAEPAESSGIYLLKVDSNGYKQWCKYYDGREYRGCNSVWQTTNGFVMTGSVVDEYGGVYRTDAFVLATDWNGNELWYTTLSPLTSDAGLCVQQTLDGGYVVCGTLGWRDGSQYYNHMFVAKLESARTRK